MYRNVQGRNLFLILLFILVSCVDQTKNIKNSLGNLGALESIPIDPLEPIDPVDPVDPSKPQNPNPINPIKPIPGVELGNSDKPLEKNCLDLNSISVPLSSDTYVSCQWHLDNLGQRILKNFSSLETYLVEPRTGVDLDGTNIFSELTGKGVNVLVVDDGLDWAHEDIVDNFVRGRDFCQGSTTPDAKGSHGTRVTGIIGAVGDNHLGVRGIASEVSLYANNFISVCQNPDFTQKFIESITEENIDIWNGSFGFKSNNGFQPRTFFQTVYDTFTGVLEKRDTVFVKPNGNDWKEVRGQGAFDPFGSHFGIVHVGAINYLGKVTDYSNRGSNILISSFSGEDESNSHYPGILTTDLNNAYITSFSGTSAATPMVTGAVALLKEFRSDLSWEDIHILLAKSAIFLKEDQFKNSPIPNIQYINWEYNQAGYGHSFNSGFGALSINELLEEAKSYQSSGSQLKVYNNSVLSTEVSDLELARSCQTKSLMVENDFQVFSLEIALNVRNVDTRQIFAYLITPNNKKFQILVHSDIPGVGLASSQKIKSLQAFGINAKGEWGIEVCSNADEKAIYKNAEMKIYGFEDMDTIPIKGRP